MKWITAAVVFTIAAPALQGQTLSSEEVEAAIKAGQNRKFNQLISDCVATAGWGESIGAGAAGGIQRTGSFDVIVSRNAGRIAFLAANAKRLYKNFTIADVPESLLTPGVFVSVEPQTPARSSNTYRVPALIDGIVLKSKDRPDVVVQPELVDTEPVEWKNLLGGSVDGNRAVARFPLDAVKELPAGEFDIVIITEAGERRCKVGNNDRKRLFD